MGRLVLFLFLFLFGVVFVPEDVCAQVDAEVEALYDRFSEKESSSKKSQKRKRKKNRKESTSSITDLGNLNPFEDVAVIQRRFLPKTSRFEFSSSLMGTTNNAFFTNLGLALKGIYYFNETFGAELKYFAFTSDARSVTTNLEENQKIRTSSFVQPKSYQGVGLKWVPMYGKMAWFDKEIIPFDFYFSPGVGTTTTALDEQEFTISLAAGQNLALSKSIAIHWDITWNYYQALTVQGDTTSNTTEEVTSTNSDLILSFGLSFFIPEATYR